MRSLFALAVLLGAAPALAASGEVPEPSSIALFGLGVLGVLVGRQGAKRRKRD